MSQHHNDPNDYDPNQDNQWEEPAPEPLRRIEVSKAKKKKAKGATNQQIIRYAIYVLVAIAVIVTAKNLFSPNKLKRNGWVLGYPPVKLTPDQLKEAGEMGKSLAAAMTSGHGDECHGLTNWTVAMARIESGVDQDMVARTALRKKINEDWAGQSPGLFRGILMDQGRNDIKVDAAFLRMTERDGYAAALVRCSPSLNRVEYHEVLIYPVKEEGGKLRIIDVFDRQSGIYASDRLRWAGIQESGVKAEEHGQWLATFGEIAKPNLLDLKTLISQDVLRNGAAAYHTISGLPEPLRKTYQIYALEYWALRNAMDDPKKGLTEEMKARLLTLLNTLPTDSPNPPETAPLQAEFFFKEGRQPEAEAQLTKLHEKVKDGYLKYMISKWRLEKGDVSGAETAYQQAKAESPGLWQLFNHGKAIEAKKAGATP